MTARWAIGERKPLGAGQSRRFQIGWKRFDPFKHEALVGVTIAAPFDEIAAGFARCSASGDAIGTVDIAARKAQFPSIRSHLLHQKTLVIAARSGQALPLGTSQARASIRAGPITTPGATVRQFEI